MGLKQAKFCYWQEHEFPYTICTTLRLRQEGGGLDFFLYGKVTEKLLKKNSLIQLSRSYNMVDGVDVSTS